ncbi:MAG: hypothetical protein PHE59_01895 [Patescibacteria group bacterium]|nr:hypothetical protein [Patescibacteria group bacterium]MDD5164097.1 hypothetical protein [Patescibacteria group bacterium]MDD5534245.1 hypothetical protein [Patescibacteria group bacterium]
MEVKALKQTLKTIWDRPILWLLGFLGIPFAVNEISLVIVNIEKIDNWINNLITFKVIRTQFGQIFSSFNSQSPAGIKGICLFIIIIILTLLFFYISFLVYISFLFIVRQLRNKENLIIPEILQKSKKYIIPVVGLNLISFFIIYGFLSLVGLTPLYKIQIPIFVYIIFFILIEVFISFVSRYIVCFLVLEQEKFYSAIKKGVVFFIKNWFITIKTSLILFLITVLFGLIILLISIGVSWPCFFLFYIFLQFNLTIGFWLVFLFWIFILSIILIFFISILSAFQFLIWNNLFLQISHPEERL